MTTKHTPGPWKYSLNFDSTADIGTADYHVARLSVEIGPTLEANARLIAAAPALLEALMQIERMDGTDHWWKYQDIARAAIAKATGE